MAARKRYLVCLTDAEHEHLTNAAKALGYQLGTFIRTAAMQQAGPMRNVQRMQRQDDQLALPAGGGERR